MAMLTKWIAGFRSKQGRPVRTLAAGLRRKRLAVEHLEDRLTPARMTSTAGDFLTHSHSHDHDHDGPPAISSNLDRTATHFIDGMSHQFTWEPAPASGDAQPLAAEAGALHPLTSIPLWRSNPSATAKLYLDFDGDFTPVWGGYSNITTPAYDIDGDPTTFNDRELENIESTYRRAVEDFAPFNIDVTTIEPSVLAAGQPTSAANGIAMRVAIGGTGDWHGSGAGGVAYINSFTSTIANVCYVFAANADIPFWMGNTVSHEAGHAFGLQHQSTYDANGAKVLEYNSGTRDWGPIMGTSYYATAATTWHNGQTTSATTFQDDMAILANSTNGFGYRADDRGNTIGTATALTQSGNTWSGSGIIERNTDVDMFSFTVTVADTYRVIATGDATSPNLDAVLELRNSSGTVLAAANSPSTLNAELREGLTPGTYYVAVKSTGAYGWVGQYSVAIDTPPAGITVTPASSVISTDERGRSSSFTVVLETQPSANVAIAVNSTNTSEGTASTSSLVFTPENWDIPQAVTITGVADGVADGDAAYSIVLGAALSADPKYNGNDPADIVVGNIDIDTPGFLYSVDFGAGTLNRARLDGTQTEPLVDLRALLGSTGRTKDFAIDDASGKIYWTATDGSTVMVIQRSNLDGSNVETLRSEPYVYGSLRGITLDAAAGKMYWIDNALHGIRRANLDGTGVEDIVVGTGSTFWAMHLALDSAAGKIYWTDFGAGTANAVRRANLDGSNIEVIWARDTPTSPSGLALDLEGGKVYWSDSSQDLIRRANLDGSNVEVLVDMAALGNDNSNVLGLALDSAAGKFYWTDDITDTIYRANLDGSRIVALGKSAGAGLEGIAISHPGPGISVTHRGGLVTKENGESDVLRISLTSKPTANVTIALATSDATEGIPSTTTLTFTPANWNITQTVTVTGVDDSTMDGNVAYTIVLSAAVSADANYHGIDPADASVTNLDNDSVKFVVVDDASTNRAYRYGSTVNGLNNSTLSSGNSAPRGAASTVVGDKVWVVDANKNVYVYSPTGTLLGSWSANSLAKNAVVEGITVWGNDVWIVDARLDRVYRYANAASRLSGTQNAASYFQLHANNIGPKDLVTDGTHFWVVDDQTLDKVYKYTVAGAYVGNWAIDPANASPTGITLDPANPRHLWIVDNGTDRVYQYNDALNRTSLSQNAAVSFALAAGNTNPQGIADPPTSAIASGQSIASSTNLPGRADVLPGAGGASPARAGDNHADDMRRTAIAIGQFGGVESSAISGESGSGLSIDSAAAVHFVDGILGIIGFDPLGDEFSYLLRGKRIRLLGRS